MSNNVANQGPKKYRALIGFFSVVLTLLFFWLIGFFVSDLGNVSLPDYGEIHSRYVNRSQEDERDDWVAKVEDLDTQIENLRQDQANLETSTQNSQQTLNQLSETLTNRVDGQTPPTQAELDAISQAREIFLDNQKRFQEANVEIARLNEERRKAEKAKEDVIDRITDLEVGFNEEYDKALGHYKFWSAVYKLIFLLPLLFVATWLLKTMRSSRYKNLSVALFVASFVHVVAVIHNYFPSEYFKYIAVLGAIAVVIGVLHYVIKRIANPGRKWLVNQYQEAYQKHRCPVCSYPIERGAFRQALWSGKGPKAVFATGQSGTGPEKETPYTCPSCGTGLFSECDSCHHVRHTLLPYCEHCGVENFPVAATEE